jgi:hypothetical protein
MNKKPIIQIILPVFHRIDLLKLCLRSIQRLQQDNRYTIRCLIAWSHNEDKQNIGYFFDNKLNTSIGIPNDPLGAKLNAAIEFSLNHMNHFDYYMALGSDDLLSTDYLDKINPYISKGVRFFGPDKLLFVDQETKAAKYHQTSYMFGAGRLVHRSLLEGRNYWYKELNKGLDNSLTENIYECNGLTPDTMAQAIASTTPLVCDIKSASNNIHSFHSVEGEAVELSRFASLFPELERL